MRISSKSFSMTLFVGLLAGGLVFFQAASADDDRAGGWLPMSQLVAKLEGVGFRNIEKIEREHGRYEVRATNRQGERSKLQLDAHTGELLAQRVKGQGSSERRDTRELRQAGNVANSGECNKRRCRDDMPIAPTGSR